MDSLTMLSDKPIIDAGIVSREFLHRGVASFVGACRYVYRMPYGYNSDRDDLMILFKEAKGSCTTKHSVIGTLAQELDLPVNKTIAIYAMTEAIVTGTDRILEKYGLPYVPMIHCFLAYDRYRVDLTEGNHNGKNQPIGEFLHTQQVVSNISGKEEYLIYRKTLTDSILAREELNGADIKTILHAREEGLALLKANIR
jgi:hypothetical protein